MLGVQALVNTVIRAPTGWLLDHSPVRQPYVLGGMLSAGLLTASFPLAHRTEEFLLLAAALGLALGVAFVAVGAILTEATTPATRGGAMGGYSTAIYVGFAAAAFGLGPVMGAWGYGSGFAMAGGLTAVLAVGASLIRRQR